MFVTLQAGLLAALAACLFGCSAASGADTILDATVPLETPRKEAPRGGGPLDKVEMRLWMPEGVRVLKGAIVNPFNLTAVEQAHWQEAARSWQFAIVGANFFGVRTSDCPALLAAALREFGARSGHNEIEHLPLCFVGFSAGAGMSRNLAAAMPERTLAVAPVGLEVGPKSDETRKIPILTIFGEKDGRQGEILAAALPTERRQKALWGTAVQWGVRHEFAFANNLVIPFFDQVIRRRYPKERTPESGPVTLLPIQESEGWLGDTGTWGGSLAVIGPYSEYKGDRSEACWLPNKYIALVWRAFVSKAPAVKIQSPEGFGDGKPFRPHPADTPLTVAIEDASPTPPKRIEIFDGDIALGQMTRAPYQLTLPRLAPGVHTLFAVATYENNEQATSRASTIIVTANGGTR